MVNNAFIGSLKCLLNNYCWLGSMLDVIKHQKKKGNCEDGLLDEVIIAAVLREVLKGLDYFHSQGLIHRSVDCHLLNRN